MWRLTATAACGLIALAGCGSARSTRPASTSTHSTAALTGPQVVSRRAGITIPPPAGVTRAGAKAIAEFKLGRAVAAQSGCLACHRIGEQGDAGPGPDLTELADRLPRRAIEEELIRPAAAVMPSYRHLARRRFKALVAFLASLHGQGASSARPSPPG